MLRVHKQTKARFKIRIFDMRDNKNKSISIYDDENKMNLGKLYNYIKKAIQNAK